MKLLMYPGWTCVWGYNNLSSGENPDLLDISRCTEGQRITPPPAGKRIKLGPGWALANSLVE
jgi:hypothetical protein